MPYSKHTCPEVQSKLWEDALISVGEKMSWDCARLGGNYVINLETTAEFIQKKYSDFLRIEMRGIASVHGAYQEWREQQMREMLGCAD